MSQKPYATIDSDQLAERFERIAPDNENRSQGYALVDVLAPRHFERERIPGSTNIPLGQEDRFEERFDKDKEIVVYCASPQCDASEKTARELARRGFHRVVDYEAGLSEWRDRGRPLAGTGT